MEQLIKEVTAYAAAKGIKPTTVLQNAAGLSGTTWDKWAGGDATCHLKTAAIIRDYIAKGASQ